MDLILKLSLDAMFTIFYARFLTEVVQAYLQGTGRIEGFKIADPSGKPLLYAASFFFDKVYICHLVFILWGLMPSLSVSSVLGMLCFFLPPWCILRSGFKRELEVEEKQEWEKKFDMFLEKMKEQKAQEAAREEEKDARVTELSEMIGVD